MSFYNLFTKSSDADSAGTDVIFPGETLQGLRDKDGGVFVIDAMASEGIDVKNNKQTQIKSDMLDEYDLIINMAGEEYTPIWLSQHPNYIAWNIDDPGGKGLEETNEVKDIIKARVTELIRSY